MAKKYDVDFKNHWIQRHLSGEQTLKALSQEAGIRPETLSDWIREHRKANSSVTAATPQKTKASKPTPKMAAKKTKTAASQPKKPAPVTSSSEVDGLRRALKTALEERDVLKRALRILWAPLD